MIYVKNYLNTKKDILVEETKGVYKMVILELNISLRLIENFRKTLDQKIMRIVVFISTKTMRDFNLNHTKDYIVEKMDR